MISRSPPLRRKPLTASPWTTLWRCLCYSMRSGAVGPSIAACVALCSHAQNAQVPSGASVSLFVDEEGAAPVRHFGAGVPAGGLTPVAVPGSRCFVHVQGGAGERVPCRVQVLPVPPQLGIAFWTVDFLLNYAEHWDR